MSVPFNVVQKPEPGVPGGGERKWYASITNSGEVDLSLGIQDSESSNQNKRGPI